MAVLVLTDAFVYGHGYDFTGDSNELRLAAEVEAKDRTTFGSGGYREFTGGRRSSALDLKGFWQSAASGAVDPEAFDSLGVANRAFTLGPEQVEGATAFLFQAGEFGYTPLEGGAGDLAGFSLAAQGTDGYGVVRGRLAKEKGVVSASGAFGSALNLGAVAAGQYLYATLHVFGAVAAVDGDVVIQSDDNAGFTSPTTRIGPVEITSVGGIWFDRLAGPITDTWYRFLATNVNGTYTLGGAIGIGS